MPRVEVRPVARHAFDGDVPLARIGRDEHQRGVGARSGRTDARRAVGVGQIDGRPVGLGARLQRVVGCHEVGVLDCPGTPAHTQSARVAAAVGAGVAAGRVDDGGGADDGELGGFLEGEDGVVVFEQDDAVACDGADVVFVVGLHVGFEVGGWVAGVLLEEVPGGEDALDHVVQARLGDLAVVDGRVELGAPEDGSAVVVAAGHGHVHAVICGAVGGVLSVPVAHDIAFEA